MDKLLRIDNPVLACAKASLDYCLQEMMKKAVSTGSMEGKTTLTINVELEEWKDKDTGEIFLKPEIKYKATSSVPMKSDMDGKVMGLKRMQRNRDGDWLLVDNQVTMDDIMEEGEDG